MEYFQINRISNSDLSKFKAEIVLRIEYKQPKNAFNFGSVFHAMLLEPELPSTKHTAIDYELVEKLVEKVKNETFCKRHLVNGIKEQIILFEDPTTLAKCKARLDLHTVSLKRQKKIIVDFKTTQAKDYAAFLRSLLEYDYDRQAAFYTDSIKAETFVFIGIQKIKPYDLFFFEASKAPGFLQYGRKKYKVLLKKYVAHYNLAAYNFYKHVA